MSNTQLFVIIAFPSVLIILSCALVAFSWKKQDKRLAQIEANIGSLAREIRSCLKDMRSEMITLRGSLHERLTTVEAKQR